MVHLSLKESLWLQHCNALLDLGLVPCSTPHVDSELFLEHRAYVLRNQTKNIHCQSWRHISSSCAGPSYFYQKPSQPLKNKTKQDHFLPGHCFPIIMSIFGALRGITALHSRLLCICPYVQTPFLHLFTCFTKVRFQIKCHLFRNSSLKAGPGYGILLRSYSGLLLYVIISAAVRLNVGTFDRP